MSPHHRNGIPIMGLNHRVQQEYFPAHLWPKARSPCNCLVQEHVSNTPEFVHFVSNGIGLFVKLLTTRKNGCNCGMPSALILSISCHFVCWDPDGRRCCGSDWGTLGAAGACCGWTCWSRKCCMWPGGKAGVVDTGCAGRPQKCAVSWSALACANLGCNEQASQKSRSCQAPNCIDVQLTLASSSCALDAASWPAASLRQGEGTKGRHIPTSRPAQNVQDCGSTNTGGGNKSQPKSARYCDGSADGGEVGKH